MPPERRRQRWTVPGKPAYLALPASRTAAPPHSCRLGKTSTSASRSRLAQAASPPLGKDEIATLAIRTCGGQAMLKSLPLERIYRDSRCGSLMLPWTAELCLDRIGREALNETGETDD